ncbi:MAG TPA: RDD family protein [Ktedonobacterales bacterium]|nr:RDD family protein [Ktedonobacterales bacterium]
MDRMAIHTSHAQSHAHTHAGFISRAIAFVLDIVVMSVAVLAAVALLQALLGFFTLYGLIGQRVVQSSPFREIGVVVIALIGVGIAVGYPVVFWVLLGQTPGKLLMGVRIARTNGKPLTIGRALLRYLGYWLSAIPLGLGFFWVLVDDQRQCWHDKLADTYVIYDSRAPVPLSSTTSSTPHATVARPPLPPASPSVPGAGSPRPTSEDRRR